VEFLLDSAGRYYFLEVNTRLQVEHPVTEMVTGVDLVHAQVGIAGGDPRALPEAPVMLRGHAIECRVYAEDPASDFAPSPGRITHLHEPRLPGVRIDSGIRSGLEVPVHYDPILSKVIAWAPTRLLAISRMQQALVEYAILGPRTNLPFLRAIVGHPAFAAGDLSTEFLVEHLAGWQPPPASPETFAVLAGLVAATQSSLPAARARGPFADPWERLSGWRLS
jgi:acetyl/propionyl-CoA carboxylase alpha subunit